MGWKIQTEAHSCVWYLHKSNRNQAFPQALRGIHNRDVVELETWTDKVSVTAWKSCSGVKTQPVHFKPNHPFTHSLTAAHAVRSELVLVKQPVSDFLNEQWTHRVSLVSAAQWSEQKLQLVCTELEFVCPPPLWPSLTGTDKHSSLVIRTWSAHEAT